ncbi:MFS transporter [Vibrio sp. NTOU-M3]|uniref:MFS transporter n=1 Tax=Vibrio sp. NTOU-M3 TaxID=3234954 RepID=UPI00349F4FF4
MKEQPVTLSEMLSDKQLSRYLLSSALAFIAGNMINFSIIFYSQQVLNSTSLSGIGYFLVFGPPVLFGWYAGILCDRSSPLKVVVGFQCLAIAIVATMLTFHTLESDATTLRIVITACAFFIGVCWSFLGPGRFSSVSKIVEQRIAVKATSAMSSFVLIAFGIAPVIVTTLSAYLSWESVFSLIIGLLCISLLLLKNIKFNAPQSSYSGKKSWIRDITASIKYVGASCPTLHMLLFTVITYTCMGVLNIYLPALAANKLGLDGLNLGIFLGLLSVGLIIGSTLSFRLIGRISADFTIPALITVSVVSLLASVHQSYYVVLVALVLIISICNGFVMNLIIATIQQLTEESYRGRVISIYTILTQISPATGAIVAGFIIDYHNIEMLKWFIILLFALGLVLYYAIKSKPAIVKDQTTAIK